MIYNTMYIIYLQNILFAPDSTILEESNMHFGPYIYIIQSHTPFRCVFFVFTGRTKQTHYWPNKVICLEL